MPGKLTRIILFAAAFACAFRAGGTEVYAARKWDPYDHKIIYDRPEWVSFNASARFNYVLSFIDDINDLLGLQGDERVQRQHVHMVTPDNPKYYEVGEAYTTRDRNIYLNMDKLCPEGYGGGYALMVLAHEMKHVEQIIHGRVNWDTANMIDYSIGSFVEGGVTEMLYSSQPHEIEAENFAIAFPSVWKAHWDEMRGAGAVLE